MIDLSSIAHDVEPLVKEAGGLILEDWKTHNFHTKLKDVRDIVTDTDKTIEEFLRKKLYSILPQAGFIVEEGTTDKQGEFNWTIDPIDGTKYFATDTPLFYTQVSLLRNGNPVIGFIYQPVSNQLFSAVQGRGAFLNQKKISAPEKKGELKSAIVEFDMGSLSGEENKWKFSLIEQVCNLIYRPRFSSGYLTIYLATGAIDASINADFTLPYSIKNIVDISPRSIILSEAGLIEKSVPVGKSSISIRSSAHLLRSLSSLFS